MPRGLGAPELIIIGIIAAAALAVLVISLPNAATSAVTYCRCVQIIPTAALGQQLPEEKRSGPLGGPSTEEVPGRFGWLP